jgi:hypothetical protein
MRFIVVLLGYIFGPLAHARTVILGFESRGTHAHILLFQDSGGHSLPH